MRVEYCNDQCEVLRDCKCGNVAEGLRIAADYVEKCLQDGEHVFIWDDDSRIIANICMIDGMVLI